MAFPVAYTACANPPDESTGVVDHSCRGTRELGRLRGLDALYRESYQWRRTGQATINSDARFKWDSSMHVHGAIPHPTFV
jgi:hypothetical protein